jgi:hypothetical protein
MKHRKGKIAPAVRAKKMNLDKCLTLVLSTWGEGFCASSYFKNLPEEERLVSESIVGFFTEMMFDYFGLTPLQWNEDYMKECCVYLFPEKISEGSEFFRCVTPVLSAFFTYLEEQHLQQNAGAMVHGVKTLHERIMERSSNPETWGVAKRIVMAMRADGIDVTDEKAVQKFIQAYNQKVLKNGPDSSILRGAPHDVTLERIPERAARKR